MFYNKRYLMICLVRLLCLVVAHKVLGEFAILAAAIFLARAFVSNKKEDLLFWSIWLGTSVVVNPHLMPKGTAFFIVQRATLAVLAVINFTRCFGRMTPKTFTPLRGVLCYLIYMTIPSSLGWSPIVSFLKLLLFFVCFVGLFGSASTVAASMVSYEKVRSVMLSFAVFYIAGSILLIPFPGISQLSGEEYALSLTLGKDVTSLFSGMTSHSQCLGPVAAAISCLLLGDMLFGLKRPDRLYIFLLLLCPVVIYKTSSRTAMGTLLAGVMILMSYFIKARGIGSAWRRKVVNVVMGMCVLFVVALTCSSGMENLTTKFLVKRTSDDPASSNVTFETVTSSRQALFEEGIANFQRSPLVGNGFQVSQDMEGFSIKSIKDAISAPVEKSIWVSAVLEEGGAIGFIVFVAFIITSLCMMARQKAYIGASAFLVLIVANFGEFMIFSMSYTGGFLWMMVFIGLILDTLRNKENAKQFYYEQEDGLLP